MPTTVNQPVHITNDDYANFLQYVKDNKRISYYRFDAGILHNVNLFALHENFDFDALQETMDAIINTLPAIKRIFANPITRIKTTSEILPVESVRVINNETVQYASFHSELWENITKDGLKPRKLLTQDNQDNYAIYENIVFAELINDILRFVSKNIRLLNNILFASRDLTFNLLDRDNHLSYFLSIGKLHTGYIRDYEKHSAAAENCLNKLLFIDRIIRSRLNSPVYKHCKRIAGNQTLKKTNVFRMHKDYHRIYLLLKWLSDTKESDWSISSSPESHSTEGYPLFCSMLSVFAAGHFNFIFDENDLLDFEHLNNEATFCDWRLRLKSIELSDCKALEVTVSKNKTYRALLLFTADRESTKLKSAVAAKRPDVDEFLVATETLGDQENIVLSIYDIDSFRRLQQIFLRGMVYSDESHDICPFCGQHLLQVGDVYECGSCRTQIMHRTCPETSETYYTTRIKNFTPNSSLSGDTSRRNKHSMHKYISSQMHFRNITELSEELDCICPRCGRIHS